MKEFRVVTESGMEIMRASEKGCENYWDSCDGIYIDESGEHYLSIEEI